MDEKCFCHITDCNGNTYVVKDKEARENIKKLTPVNDIIQNEEKPVTSGAVYSLLNGLATLLDGI